MKPITERFLKGFGFPNLREREWSQKFPITRIMEVVDGGSLQRLRYARLNDIIVKLKNADLYIQVAQCNKLGVSFDVPLKSTLKDTPGIEAMVRISYHPNGYSTSDFSNGISQINPSVSEAVEAIEEANGYTSNTNLKSLRLKLSNLRDVLTSVLPNISDVIQVLDDVIIEHNSEEQTYKQAEELTNIQEDILDKNAETVKTNNAGRPLGCMQDLFADLPEGESEEDEDDYNEEGEEE